jgi:hypothetical protein
LAMQHLWCWRCRNIVPMLDDNEYGEVFCLYGQAMKSTKEFRQRWNIPLEHASIEQRFQPVRTYYERLTGMKNCHENAILHHKLSLYGPPCKNCQKPLRTPHAKLCGSCMTPVDSN